VDSTTTANSFSQRTRSALRSLLPRTSSYLSRVVPHTISIRIVPVITAFYGYVIINR